MHPFHVFCFSLVIFTSLAWPPFVTALADDSTVITTLCTACISDVPPLMADQVVQTPTVTLVIAPPSVVITTTTFSTAAPGPGAISGQSDMSSISPFPDNSSVSANTTQPPTMPMTTSGSTTGNTSTSGVDALKIHPTLRSILGIYTITFTLFLLPIPNSHPLELLILTTTALTGWTLLYLDSLLPILSNPKPHLHDLASSFSLGLHYYISERWQTYQLIRRRNPPDNPRLTRPHLMTSFRPPWQGIEPAKIKLGAWWKSDVLKSLKSHTNLRDYILIPQNFSLEKYVPAPLPPRGGRVRTPPPMSVARRGGGTGKHHEDDIFSSDEELDTSPLATRMFAVARGSGAARGGPGGAVTGSGDSKKTVVDEGVSEREKVSGFISWDALKRDLGEAWPAEEGGVAGEGDGGVGIARTQTEGSGESWEREALGAAV